MGFDKWALDLDGWYFRRRGSFGRFGGFRWQRFFICEQYDELRSNWSMHDGIDHINLGDEYHWYLVRGYELHGRAFSLRLDALFICLAGWLATAGAASCDDCASVDRPTKSSSAPMIPRPSTDCAQKQDTGARRPARRRGSIPDGQVLKASLPFCSLNYLD
jgi:hypothetical protein